MASDPLGGHIEALHEAMGCDAHFLASTNGFYPIKKSEGVSLVSQSIVRTGGKLMTPIRHFVKLKSRNGHFVGSPKTFIGKKKKTLRQILRPID